MHDAIIVGAGIGGLRVNDMLRESGIRNVRILEARAEAGGRIRTVYDDRGSVEYEAGPWRIPDSHRRAIDLFRRHGIELRPIKTRMPSKVTKSPVIPGLTAWDVLASNTLDPLQADRRDYATGYNEETYAESSTSPYMTEARTYFVADDGFSALAQSMASTASIEYDTRVVDIVFHGNFYSVQCVQRIKNRFVERVHHAHAVFVCVPPHVAREWPHFCRDARGHLSCVESACLHHIYVSGDAGKRHAIHPLIGQTVGDQYGSGFFQASYSAGRIARMWYHLRLAYPSMFARLLTRAMKVLMGLSIVDRQVRSHFWEHAYHRWRSVPGFNLEMAVRNRIHPHPIRLPNLFWVGEAFSSYQAWIEGALETAELAVKACISRRISMCIRNASKDEMVLDNRILGNLREWARVHPGSEKAILSHLGEDISHLFRHINHSDHAWATLLAMQVGWTTAN